MKILQVIQSLTPEHGGPPFQVAELSEYLIEQGCEVTVLTWSPCRDKRYVRQIERAGGRVIELPALGEKYPVSAKLFSALSRLAAKNDAVHFWSYWGLHLVAYRLIPASKRRPFAISAVSTLPVVLRSRLKKRIFNKLVGHSMLRQAGANVAISNNEAELYVARGVSPGRICTIPLALPDSFAGEIAPPNPRPVRTSIVEILFLGRIHEKKGLQFLLPALAELKTEIAQVRLSIVGPDGGYRTRLEQQVQELGLDSIVKFHGPAYGKDKLEHLRRADIFILPSVLEQIGHAILEGAAAGLPVIYTRACEFPELARSGGGIELADHSELTAALRSLIAHPELRVSMGKRARACILSNFVWSKVGERYLQMYESIAGRRQELTNREVAVAKD